jgi:DNA polymerase IV
MSSPNSRSREKYSGFQLDFNHKPSTLMHIDLNSCFATIEQQANPQLRGKPLAVAAYNSPAGCILAASIEAKRLGIKTGMRVKDGRLICPELIVKEPDPWKYRNVHLSLRQLLSRYTDQITPKSIDEFVLNLEGCPAYVKGMTTVGREIKTRILQEIGDWLTVSIGIGPNRFLAKTAAGLHKPDGLDEINHTNYLEIYQQLNLQDLCGIASKNMIRLNQAGIYTVTDMFTSPLHQLKAAFHSILGYYWYLRLHGWEIDDVDFNRSSFGNSFALPKPLIAFADLAPIMMKLTEKMAGRMRQAGWFSQGVHLAIVYRDLSHWHMGFKTPKVIFESREIYKYMVKLYSHCPYQKPVRELAVSCFNLVKNDQLQLDLFGLATKQASLTQALDEVNQKWGNFVITPALMLHTQNVVHDRIAFGGIKEIEEFALKGSSSSLI